MRKIGTGDLVDIPWGSHFCQLYYTREDLIDILVPYFKKGLENNECCMWVTSESLSVENAKAALKKEVHDLDDYIKKGQIEILDASQWFTKSRRFDSNRVLQGWIAREEQALKRGFKGLRLAGNTFWLKKKHLRNFSDYEAELNNIINKHQMIAICSYPLDKWGKSEVIDVVSNHRFVLIKREGKWKLIESSEHKLAEETVRQSQHHYKQLLQGISDAVIVYDSQARFLDCNEATLQQLGYSREEFLSLEPADIVHPDFHQVMEDNQRKILAGKATLVESAHRCKDGGIIPVEVNARRIEYSGEPAILAVVRDITERKRAEEGEEKFRAQLIRLEKMAGIGTLAGGVAHEMSNLLQIMSGHVQFAQKTSNPEDITEALGIVMHNSDRAAKIIKDLITFSTAEASEKEQNNITEPIESVLSLTEEQLKKQNIQVVRKYERTPSIEFYKAEMQQVFLNLVANARDAMLPRGGKLEISVKQAGENVEMSVTDTGKGIKKKYLKKVFDPFFTIKEASAGDSKVHGAGLGLSVSYGIVKRHGGTIEVESEVGKGTAFTVTLPLKGVRAKGKIPKEEKKKEVEKRKHMKILVVDDEAEICKIFTKWLSVEGYRVKSALTGKKAINLVKDDHFSVVFLDVVMPGIPAVEVLEEIKEISPKTKVVMITGKFIDKDLSNELRQKGASSFLQKPFKIEDIREIIGNAKKLH